MKTNLLSLMVLLLAGSAFAAGPIPPALEGSTAALEKSTRHGEWVDIAVPGAPKPLHTFVVYPEIKDKAPIVLVIHDIFGMADWPRAVADQLAAEGFIAICPDMLSIKGGAIGGITPADVISYLNACRDYGIKLPAANGKSAVIGFCWGGGHSFTYAASQPELNAAVVYYGTPVKEDQMAKIKCPVMGNYGGNDARITATVPQATEQMKKAGKSYSPHVYDGAGHGFLRNRGTPANVKAAEDAWPLTITFLKENTK